jgi:hypothetical protein
VRVEWAEQAVCGVVSVDVDVELVVGIDVGWRVQRVGKGVVR